MNDNKINLLLVIGLWIPVFLFGGSLIDNRMLCEAFYDDDGKLERCFNGESTGAFLILTIIMSIFSIPATVRVYNKYKSDQKKEDEK